MCWKRSGVIAICIFGILVLFSTPGGTDIRTFWTAMDNAQAVNPQIHKAEALLRATLEENPKTLAKLLPLANLRAASNLYDDTHYVNLGVDSRNLSSVIELSLRQTLYNRHDALGHDQSDSLVRAALAEMEDARQQVAMSVATSAANWLEAKEVLDLGETYIKVTKRHREVNRMRQKAGEITATDVETSSSRFAQANSTYVQSLNTLEKAAIAFREVAGSDPAPDMQLPDLSWRESSDWEEPGKMQEQLQHWIENRPDVQAAQARLEAAQLGVRMEHASHYPTVDLDYRTSRTWDSELGGSSGISLKDTIDSRSLVVSLNVPLFRGGETSARVREAKGREENLQSNLQGLRNQALRDVNQARMDIKNQQASLVWLSKALQSSQKALSGMEEEFQAGTRTLLELLDAQYDVLTLNTTLVRNRFQEQLARIRLWHALGVPLRPDSPTSFTALLASSPVSAARQKQTVVLESMDLATQTGTTRLQATQWTKPERGNQPEAAAPLPSEPAKNNPTEDLLLQSLSQFSGNSQSAATMEPTKASEELLWETLEHFPRERNPNTLQPAAKTPLDSSVEQLAANPVADSDQSRELDNLIELYTAAIIMDRPLAEGVHRAVATILQRYLPANTLTRPENKAEQGFPIAAALPMANPARGSYPENWPQLQNGPYLIHLGAFRNEQECRQLAEILADAHIPSWLDRVHTPDGMEIVRLVVGPLAHYDDVLHILKAIHEQTTLTAGWIHNPYRDDGEDHPHVP
ncbi:MAG: TolC family protein [Magnetococcales bacterium]|nr:TolC family protein [Magnetococcales bacterium]